MILTLSSRCFYEIVFVCNIKQLYKHLANKLASYILPPTSSFYDINNYVLSFLLFYVNIDKKFDSTSVTCMFLFPFDNEMN